MLSLAVLAPVVLLVRVASWLFGIGAVRDLSGRGPIGPIGRGDEDAELDVAVDDALSVAKCLGDPRLA